jgi:hypothetical protein
MRRQGISVDVRTLFAKPTLAELAATAGAQTTSIEVPANLIPLPKLADDSSEIRELRI